MAKMLKRKTQERKRNRATRATLITWGKTFVSVLLVITMSTMSYSPAIAEPANSSSASSAAATETASQNNANQTETTDTGTARITDQVIEEVANQAAADQPTAVEDSGESETAAQEQQSDTQWPKTIECSINSSEGGHYTVKVKYDEAAGIPDGSKLELVEYVRQPDSEHWRTPGETERFASADYLAQRASVVAKNLGMPSDGQVFYAKFLDVSLTHDGEAITPAAPVEVTVETTAVDVSCSDAIGVAELVYDEATAKNKQAVQDGYVADDGKTARTLDAQNKTGDADEQTGAIPADDNIVALQFSMKEFGELALAGIAVPKATLWQDEAGTAQVLGPASLGVSPYETSAYGLAEDQELLGAYALSADPWRSFGTTLWARYIASAQGDEAGQAQTAPNNVFGYALSSGVVTGDPTTLGDAGTLVAFRASDGVAFARTSATEPEVAEPEATEPVDEQPQAAQSEAYTMTQNVIAFNGVAYNVAVTYDGTAGIPDDATLQVRELAGSECESYRTRTEEVLETDDIDYLRAFDIAIMDAEGAEIEPASPVQVSINLVGAPRTTPMGVVHFGEGDPDVIYPDVHSTFISSTLDFTAEAFSVYVVVGSGGEALTPRCTYTFNVWSDGAYTEYPVRNADGDYVYSQTVKSTSELVIPQLTSTEDSTFAGWYEGTTSGGTITLASTAYDFDNATITENSAISLYAVYKQYATVVFHDQYDTSSGTFPIAYTRRAELSTEGTPTATVKISDLSTIYMSNDDTNMAFCGWSYTPITTPGAAKDDKGAAVSIITPDADGCITISENTDLYPVFKQTYWLTYYTAQAGLSASYVAPASVFSDEAISPPLPTTSRDGYAFLGWWTGTLSSTTVDGTTVETVSYGAQITNADGSLVETASDGNFYISNGQLHLRGDGTLYAKWSASYNVVTWKQATTDAVGLEADKKTYEYAETYTYDGATIGETVSVPSDFRTNEKYPGYSYIKSDSDKTIGNTKGLTVLNVYYDREGSYSPSGQTHTLTFADSVTGTGTSTMPDAVSNIAYNTSLSTYIPDENPTFVRVSDGNVLYEFTKWYLDRDCTIEADLANMTMPDRDLTVYAGWEPVKFKVDIDPNYGALYYYDNEGKLQGTGATYFNNTYDAEPIVEYTHTTRDYAESSSGTYFYVNHNRAYNGADRFTYYTDNMSEATEDTTFEYAPGTYSYAGWYEVYLDENGNELGEATQPYDFSQHTDHNTKLRLHWKKAGTYHLGFDAGAGKLEDGTTTSEVLAEGYADYSDTILTRSAIAPSGSTFVGWRVYNSDDTLIYTPGQLFTLHAENAVRTGGKEVVFLDAVYAQADTARIVYNANGGTVSSNTIDFGSIPSASGSTAATGTVDESAGTATVSGLVNNSNIVLGSGAGFSYTSNDVTYTLAGWSNKAVYDPDDKDAKFYELGGTYGVDSEEPVTLYAVWKTTVTYHLNSDTAGWGGDWASPYEYDSATNTYREDVYLGGAVDEPTYIPTYTGTDGKLFRYWTAASDNSAQYDFSQGVASPLNLYAHWEAASTVAVHAVDASNVALAEKTPSDTDWVFSKSAITAGTTETALNAAAAATYVTAPSNYTFAFAALHDPSAGVNAISEAEAITAIKYDSAQKCVCVKYQGAESFTPMPSGYQVYFVYYKEKALPIGYKSMLTSGELTNATVSSSVPTTTGTLGSYNVQSTLASPLSWQSDSVTHYDYFAYAIGDANAPNASALHLLTDASGSDENRPKLQVRNTWRGFEYSEDGGSTWTSCGYNPALYVIYYTQQPTVIMFQEQTLGTKSALGTSFTYNVTVTQNGADQSLFSGTYTLSSGEAQSAILFYDASTTQTITITQMPVDGFTTSVSANGGDDASSNLWTYTSNGSTATQTVTFTNKQASLPIQVHVAQVEHVASVGDSCIVLRDSNRSTTAANYSFDLALGESATLLTQLPSTSVYTDTTNTYAFGAVIDGDAVSTEGGVINAGNIGIASIAFAQVNGNEYELVLHDADGNLLGELGDNSLYYLYYPMPKIQYMKESSGTLSAIQGSRIDSATGNPKPVDYITYDHATVTMNNTTVAQGQTVEIPLSGLTLSQEGNNFRMPPVLDDGIYERYLTYAKIGAGAAGATSTSGMAVSSSLAMQLRIENSGLQYSFDGSTWKKLPLAGTPTIYAIYAERGYDLQISKAIDLTEAKKTTDLTKPGNIALFVNKTFPITISSLAITESSYEIEGYDEATIGATPAVDGAPGTISLTVGDGTKVKIKNLPKDDYTITEADNATYTLTAKAGSITGSSTSAVKVVNNTDVPLALDAEKKVELTNTPKAICQITDNGVTTQFYTIQSAVDYTEGSISTKTATVEMLVDYLMPTEDTVTIPADCNITLTTAASGFSGQGLLSVITRGSHLANVPLFTNNGSLAFTNITLEGGSVVSTKPMIQSAGNLTIDGSATVQNVVNSGNGGAINATAGNITVSSGTITKCQAAAGGAIYYTGSGTISVDGTGAITSNTAASGNGGGIYATLGTVALSGTASLSNNKAESGNGGAIYVGSAMVNVDQNASITGNTALAGGAVYAAQGTISVSKAEDVDPPSITGNTATGGNGGAFYVDAGSIAVSGGNLTGNAAASGNGGAIYTNGASVAVSGDAAIGASGSVNTAVSGGAVYAESGIVTVSGGSISGNTATANGGAVYAGSGAVTVSGGSIAGNTAATSGGAIYAGAGNVGLSNAANVSRNTATAGDGGAIYAGSGTVSVSCENLNDNTATAGNGGAIYATSGTVTLNNVAVSGNTAGASGGAVYAGTGAVSVTGGSMTHNAATLNGGGIYGDSGAVNLSNVTFGGTGENSANTAGTNGGAVYAGSGALTTAGTVAFTGNTASAGKGGAVYIGSGSATLASATSMTGNSAVNGAAIFINTGKATFTGGAYTTNVASTGGAIGMGDTSARLTFTGDVNVSNNTLGNTTTKSNIYLDQDSKDVLIMTSLGNNANLGIYVPDSLTSARDVPGARFATYTDDVAVTTAISNDRRTFSVQKDTANKQLFWGMEIKVEVRYQASFAGGFPPTAAHTVKKSEFTYYPEFASAAISELANDIYNSYSLDLTSTAVYGTAFAGDATQYSDYITNLDWDSTNQVWKVKKRNGAVENLDNRKIIIYYAEPAYLSIENNTGSALDIRTLTVGGQSVINTDSVAGYGTVFAKNGSIRTALLPATESDLKLAKSASIIMLVPGGQSMAYSLGGTFGTIASDTVRLRRGISETLPEEELSVDSSGAFANLIGTTASSNSTYRIVFGDDRYICKVVDAVGEEHRYTTISGAISDIQTGAISLATANTATIQMLVDYLLPSSDVVNIPKGYDITLTTASTGTYQYEPVDENEPRATISRDSSNMNSMINSWNDAVSSTAGTTFRINDLVFDGKSVRGNSDGGAVSANYTNVYIDNVDFKNVYAKNGGALLVMHGGKGSGAMKTVAGTVLEVRNSTFVGCTSTVEVASRLGGGAIVTNAETMTLDNCSFDTCTAGDQAGAVFHRVDGNYSSWTNITNCSFTNCQAKAAGGLELDSKTITVSDTTFERCAATQRNGGGFNAYQLNSASPTADCWVTVTRCTFNDCHLTGGSGASGNGGGFRSTSRYTTIVDSTFTNDSSVNYGGAVALSNSNAVKAEIYGCTINGCSSVNYGGGVYYVGKELIVSDAYNVDSDGNPIFATSTAEVAGTQYVAPTTIENCTAKRGGGIFHDKDANETSLTIANATIEKNASTNDSGGGVYSKARTVAVTGSTISNNTANGAGGGLYAYNCTTLDLIDSTISNNTASNGDGGGVWFDYANNRANQVLTMRGCTLDGNTCSKSGGAVFTQAKTAAVEGSHITNCTAATNAGGIYQSQNIAGSSLTITDSEVAGCTANNGTGGGVFAAVRALSATGSEISKNTATGNGGGLFFDITSDTARNDMALVLSGCTMDGNISSGGNGGGIFTMAKSVAIQDGSSVSNCMANGGGGIWHTTNRADYSLTVADSAIQGCMARNGQGGGAYANVSYVTLLNADVSDNSASSNGGGIFKDKEGNSYYLVVDHSRITGNTSGGNGGGAYCKSQLYLRNNSEVSGNRLTSGDVGNAAGVYLLNNRTVFVGPEFTDADEAAAFTDSSTIYENYTASGLDSNLRLWWNNSGENNVASVYVYCNLDGRIGVTDAAKVGTQFGTSFIVNPEGFTDDDDTYVFRADTSTLHGIIDRTDESGTKIIWAGPPIAKITGKDADGNDILLYLKSNGTGPAIFDRLDTGNAGNNGSTTAAFNVLRVAEPALFTKEGAPYTGTSYSVKMLDSFETNADITLLHFEGRTITFTTAGVDDTDGYPYVGSGTRATVVRGSGASANRSMVNVTGSLTLENIIVDGGSENGIAAGASTRCMWIEGGNANVLLSEGSVLQNGVLKSGNHGGGAYLKSGSLEIKGGAIRDCTAQDGAGVYVAGGTLTLTAGSISSCTALGWGGGVRMGGGSFTMSGGAIRGCSATKGGGVCLGNNQVMYMSGGSIVNNAATDSGGGIGVYNSGCRLYFSGKVNVSGNTSDTSKAPGNACNVELNQDSNAVINTNNGGLYPGAYIGVYVPDGANWYDKHGQEKQPFGTFAVGDSTTNLYSFVNDRNGLKGGIIEDPAPNTIYWIQIFSLEVSKTVEASASNPAPEDEEFSFTVNIRGNATASGQLDAKDIDSETGYYGEMEFTSNDTDTTTATFTLKAGESMTAVNLSEGLTYEVIENLTDDQKARYATLPKAVCTGKVGENKGRTDVDPYTSIVDYTNVLPVCKITDASGENLLYKRYSWHGSTYYVPAVYTELTGSDGAFAALGGTLYASSASDATSYAVSNGVQVQMLASGYNQTEAISVPSTIGGVVTLTTAAADASTFPYQGSGTTSTISRSGFSSDSMFTVGGRLSLETIILDGAKGSYTVAANGGIVNVPSGGQLTIGDGTRLQNSKTGDGCNGGAVYVESGGVASLASGTIQRNEVASSGNGAGVYLAEGAALSLSGSPSFGGTGVDIGGNIYTASNGSGNYKVGSLIAQTNGTKAYQQARQDIYLAGYAGDEGATNAASLIVAGEFSDVDAGSIWVWAAESPHYTAMQQFAKIQDGVTVSEATCNAFRNARTDSDADNQTESYLMGTLRSAETGCINWSGITDYAKVILRKVNASGDSWSGAVFAVYRARSTAGSPVNVDGVSLSGLTSDENGTLWIGELPYGEYYLYESSPTARWFKLTVDEEVTCTAA